MNKIHVLIVDDQRLFSESLANIIRSRAPDIKVTGVVENAKVSLEYIQEHGVPDIILMDIRMPVMNGVEGTKIIKRLYPSVKIMMLTTFDDDEYVADAIKYGAIGYLLKDMPPDELIASIHAVNGGTFQMSPSIARRLVQIRTSRIAENPETEPQDLPDWFRTLRVRERELLLLLCQGYSNKDISEQLNLAEQTVKNYVSHIYEVMGVDNRYSALKMALKENLTASW